MLELSFHFLSFSHTCCEDNFVTHNLARHVKHIKNLLVWMKNVLPISTLYSMPILLLFNRNSGPFLKIKKSWKKKKIFLCLYMALLYENCNSNMIGSNQVLYYVQTK